jgi:hypothetical protein
MSGARTDEPETPLTREEFLAWLDEHRIVHHTRQPNDQIATQLLMSGDIRLDSPGITVTVEEFYAD